MSNYQVKKVEPVVVSNDVQVRVFTLAHGDVIPWHYHRERGHAAHIAQHRSCPA